MRHSKAPLVYTVEAADHQPYHDSAARSIADDGGSCTGVRIAVCRLQELP